MYKESFRQFLNDLTMEYQHQFGADDASFSVQGEGTGAGGQQLADPNFDAVVDQIAMWEPAQQRRLTIDIMSAGKSKLVLTLTPDNAFFSHYPGNVDVQRQFTDIVDRYAVQVNRANRQRPVVPIISRPEFNREAHDALISRKAARIGGWWGFAAGVIGAAATLAAAAFLK